MERGRISKRERMGEVRLERSILGRRDLLVLRRDICNGCSICSEICPKGSITLKPAVVEGGRLLHLPSISIDEKTCILCGICAVLCPLGALKARVNDEDMAMFVERKAIPPLTKIINVAQKMCKPDCELKCEKSCPKNAIKVFVKSENDRIQEITNVKVDKDLCIYCKACGYACPYGAITVEKPFEGSITVDTGKCPQNCQICVDICPSKAITPSKDGGIEVFRELCIYCKACQRVCPKGLIRVDIERVSSPTIKSATWIKLLEELASYQTATKELVARSRGKQSLIVKDRSY